ncbi:hypothetical protein HT031_002981 [Scenedesmus sp. PABB004]|nr:hypothetical protein HT031_002981 [Scenedesmus sp. PABB004]
MEERVCIRPSYAWPAAAQPDRAALLQPCSEDAVCRAGAAGRQLAALFSGAGPDGARVALAARQLLTDALAGRWLDGGGGDLVPAAVEAAFQQCQEQLLARARAPPGQEPAPALDAVTSGASALAVALDQAGGRLLVASAGLSKAVLARSSPAGDLTVMELTPRLALGHDPTETARLDAAGSVVAYAQPAHPSGAPGGAGAAAAPPGEQQEAVLLGPDGALLAGVSATRLLGFAGAARAGVVPAPVVTSWRLNGSESFVVLGSPALWEAMSPAEVVDYVAAALASGALAAPPPGAGAGAGPAPAEAAAAGAVAGAAAAGGEGVGVGDLLTLEAQERLKLRLMDRLFGLCPGPSSPAAAGAVPSVAAVVLLLEASPPLRGVDVDRVKLNAELSSVTRACRSATEAQALQALWAASCFCCDRALAGPPAPALSCLLPVLSVAGSCWPSTFWPCYESVRAPAVSAPVAPPRVSVARSDSKGFGSARGSSLSARASSLASSSGLSFEEAAEAAGVLRPAGARPLPCGGGGAGGCGARSCAFALSSRHSCELDLSHSHGSCGCLGGGECGAPGGGLAQPDSPAEPQSVIVHKVRLAGPCELESLLFGSATTLRPDTTVARILRPSGSMASWPSAEALSPSGGAPSRSASARFPFGAELHAPPRRSASVSIGALAAGHGRLSGSGSSGGQGALHDAVAAAEGRRGSWGRDLAAGSGGLWGAAAPPLRRGAAPEADPEQQQYASDGRVKKARSYQALSALHAATSLGSAGLPGLAGAGGHFVAAGDGTARRLGAAAAYRPASAATGDAPAPGAGAGADGGAAPAPAAAAAAAPGAAVLERGWRGASSTSAIPSAGALLLLAAGAGGVAMPLSCPADVPGLAVAQQREGKVRGGVSRDQRSSARVSQERETAAASHDQAVAAALAALGGEPGCEGKVRQGVACDRRLGPRHSSDDALPADARGAGGRVAWADGAPELEAAVRGGRHKAARLARAAVSSPDLPSLAAERAAADAAFDAAAVSAVRAALCGPAAAPRASWDGASAPPAGGAPAAEPGGAAAGAPPSPPRGIAVPSAVRRAMRQLKLHRGGARVSQSAGDLLAKRLSGASSSGAGSRGSSLDSSFSASAQGGGAARPQRRGADADADGSHPVAIAGAARQGSGGLLSQDSDGAVHGGELGEEALEGQMHGGKRSSSLSLTGSMLLPSLSFTSSAGEDGDGPSCCTSPSGPPPAARRSGSGRFSPDQGGSFSADGLGSPSPAGRQQPGLASAGSPLPRPQPCGGGAPGGIQVLRMASGSFTRVRLAASAPTGEPACSPGGAGDAWLADEAGGGPAQPPTQPGRGAACAQLQHGERQACGPHGVNGGGGAREHAHSAGSSGGAPRRGGGTAVDAWTSSRAWGGAAARRSSAIQFAKVAFPSAFAAAASAASSAGAEPPPSSAGSSSTAGDLAGSCGSAASDAPAAPDAGGLPAFMAKRQKSAPLPPLQESPAPTPGSSPQLLPGGFMAGAGARASAAAGSGFLATLSEQLERVRAQHAAGSADGGGAGVQDASQHGVAVSAAGLVRSFDDDQSLAAFLLDEAGAEGSLRGDSLHGDSSLHGGSLHGSSDSQHGGAGQRGVAGSPPPCGSRGLSFEFTRHHESYAESPAQLSLNDLRDPVPELSGTQTEHRRRAGATDTGPGPRAAGAAGGGRGAAGGAAAADAPLAGGDAGEPGVRALQLRLLPGLHAEYRQEMHLMLRACQVAGRTTRADGGAGAPGGALLLDPTARAQLQHQVLSNCNAKHAAVGRAFRAAAAAVADAAAGARAGAPRAGGADPIGAALQQLRACYHSELVAATSALFAICRGFGQAAAVPAAAAAPIKRALAAAQAQHARVEQLWQDVLVAAAGGCE